MKELTLMANKENLNEVMGFIDQELEGLDCPLKKMMQVDVAVEEIFVNVANYAYAPEVGPVTIQFEAVEDPASVVITFIDQGVPYNPLEKADPDVTLSADERQIGGLGIFMVKKSMDELAYEYKDKRNIFSLKKYL